MLKRNHRQVTRIAYFMIKSLWKNCIGCFEVNLEYRLEGWRQEGWRHAEDGQIRIFTSSGRRQPSRLWKLLLKIEFKTVNTVLSQTFNKICNSNMQYV